MPGWSIGEVDATMRDRQIPNIDIQNSNLYAVMTSTVAPRMNGLFTFDILNKRINVHSQDRLDYDTNIFISYRNLAQNVEISVDEDSVFTRFNVRGDNDLNLRPWNYDEERIWNLDYFKSLPWMKDATVQKLIELETLRDRYRDRFV